ncbi:MAG TPA: TonB-dependent receptor plug domain-containing protein, partial [Gemmatimonadales bacterium]|nr:TonB-dependent receptor plug domain-containing protein [Gemmatimonadales bacterium]
MTVPGSLAELPVDRIADLLALEPGVASLDQGDLAVRGAGTDALMIYLDGVPVTPGRRDFHTALLGGSWYGEGGSGIGLGPNAFDRLTLYPGFSPASLGGALGGVVSIASASSGRALPAGGSRRIGIRGAYATDALFGTSGGLNFNRVVLNGGGRTDRLDVSVAGIVEGQGSARLGQDQNASPIYLAAGLDTTVTVTGTGTQTAVNVLRFVPSEGLRVPSSAVSSYTVLGHASYRVAEGQEVGLTVLGSQTQQRQFDYLNLYNPPQLQADRSWSRAIIGSWRGRLAQRDRLVLSGEAHLSWQTDREIDGPLTSASELASRDPFGGFLIGPLGFRFDLDNFAVNDQLVRNFRTNSGRLSPYDLTQATQYALVDQWRNNAYGAQGFSDGGGPVGRLTLARENRTVATAALNARIGTRHRVRLGAEYTGYRESYYSSQLLSQALSDAYVESPNRSALFADYTLELDRLRVDAGLRLDRFSSGASRPGFPRISTAPGFDPANPTAQFSADQSHSRWSPRIRVTGTVTDRLTAFGAVTTLAQVPDFSAIYTGINTDLSVTNPQQVYGTDLGFERATLGELGARVSLAPATTVDGTVWTRGSQRRASVVFENVFDPLRLQNVSLSRYRLTDPGSASGLDLRLSHALGGQGEAWLSYSYVDPAEHEQVSSRPHTLAAAILYNTGPDLQGPAAAVRDVGVYGAFRIASGTAYTACPTSIPNDAGVISPALCNGAPAGALFSARLPTLKVLDLRVTKSIPLGGLTLTAFVDAR